MSWVLLQMDKAVHGAHTVQLEARADGSAASVLAAKNDSSSSSIFRCSLALFFEHVVRLRSFMSLLCISPAAKVGSPVLGLLLPA